MDTSAGGDPVASGGSATCGGRALPHNAVDSARLLLENHGADSERFSLAAGFLTPLDVADYQGAAAMVEPLEQHGGRRSPMRPGLRTTRG